MHLDGIFKLILESDFVPGQKITFSSYPATTWSVDDFYVTSAYLVSLIIIHNKFIEFIKKYTISYNLIKHI